MSDKVFEPAEAIAPPEIVDGFGRASVVAF